MTQSLVLQLQQVASNGSTPLPDVLRNARMVAVKLKLTEMSTWIEHELHGYPPGSKVPAYRVMHGDVRAHNPFNGVMMPVKLGDPDVQRKLSRVESRQSIGSLHEVVNAHAPFVQVPFSEHQLAAMREIFDDHTREWLLPFRMFANTQVTAIFDAVRNRILDWALQLEAAGILGEGMTFSQTEKDAAQTVVFNISNSTIDQLNSAGTNIKGKT